MLENCYTAICIICIKYYNELKKGLLDNKIFLKSILQQPLHWFYVITKKAVAIPNNPPINT